MRYEIQSVFVYCINDVGFEHHDFMLCRQESLPPDGYLYCGYCHGTGYDYYYLGGLISEECTSCSGSGYGLNPNSSTGMPVFKGSGHVHVDEELPWKECDICKKHELYW